LVSRPGGVKHPSALIFALSKLIGP
jgi:hypothetical protein